VSQNGAMYMSDKYLHKSMMAVQTR